MQISIESNAIVVPPIGRSMREPSGVLTQAGDECGLAVHWRNKNRLTLTPLAPPSLEDLPVLKGRWLWGGVMFLHFGHFIVESLGRLWPLVEADQSVDGIVYIPKRAGASGRGPLKTWQAGVLSMFAGSTEIKTVHHPHLVEELVIPGQGFGLGHIIRGTPQFRKAVAKSYGVGVAANGAQKIYISRRKLSLTGGILHEDRIEAALAAEGYDILHPQDMSIEEQIARYKAADYVVAAEGSALHHFGFVARKDQAVAILTRRISAATSQIRSQLVFFSHRDPALIHTPKAMWIPQGRARRRDCVCEPDLPAMGRALVERGFIEGHGDWSDPSDVEAMAARSGWIGGGALEPWIGSPN